MRFFVPGLLVATLALIAAGTVLDSQRQNATLLTHSSKETAEKIVQDCLPENLPERTGKKTCYFAEFEKTAFQRGHEFAFEALREAQTRDVDALSCHLIAHSIGEGAFKRNPQDWKNQVDSISQSCTYGAIHGTVEAYAATSQGGLDRELLQQVCRETSPGSCWHILGHLTLLAAQGDLPDALEVCSVFEKETRRFSCLAGAFMENITELNLIDHEYRETKQRNTAERLESLAALCNAEEGERGEACWKEIVHAAPPELRENPQAFFAFCATAQTKEASALCKLHAVNIINSKYKYHLPALKELCATEGANDPQFEQRCYPYVATTTLLMVPQKLPEVSSFCEGLGEQHRLYCHKAVSLLIQSRSSTERKKFQEVCATQPKEAQEYCRENATLE